jgi:hypothetical protein
MSFVNQLKKDPAQGGGTFTQAELADAAWFFIERGAAGSYIGAIKGTNIYVWTVETGAWCSVTAPGGGAYSTSYLTGTNQNSYHFRSIQDTTVITNRTVTTAMQPAGTFVAKAVATIKLLTLVDGDEHTVTIQNVSTTVTAQASTTFDDMLLYTAGASEDVPAHHLIDGIKSLIQTQQSASNADFNGRWYLEGYNNSIVIRRTNEANGVVTDYSTPGGTPVAFDIDIRGGLSNTASEVFEDQITDVNYRCYQTSFRIFWWSQRKSPEQ